MFERIGSGPAEDVTIRVDGKAVPARASDTVAAALLAAGILKFRTNAVDGAPRGPWCLMGICQDCRTTVDGEPDVQTCTTPVRDGMRVSLDREGTDG